MLQAHVYQGHRFARRPAHALAGRGREVVEREEGYLNTDEQVATAAGVAPRVLGTLDQIGDFFQALDAAVRAAGQIDALPFLTWAPSRSDVAAHWERLPPQGRALSEAGALVLRREDFLALKTALGRAEKGSALAAIVWQIFF